MPQDHNLYDALALFSGGLDSILAVRLIMRQGLRVKALHFTSPFFGNPQKVAEWEGLYGLDITAVDISDAYVEMLRAGPTYGVGSVLNPCVDCKILMLHKTVELLPSYGARFIISGEVLGQRPMSQRRDTLNIIRRDAGVKGLLLRPLSALALPPSGPELAGLVRREELLGLSGRGRKEQLRLAEEFGLRRIPTPAGGCRLAEIENARSYWPVLRFLPRASAYDFRLANVGRQYWCFAEGRPYWLAVGRDQASNDALQAFTRETDWTFKVRDFPGPLALGRRIGSQDWPEEVLREAAALVASFSTKATRWALAEQKPVPVCVHQGTHGLDDPWEEVMVEPARVSERGFAEYPWERAKVEIRAALQQHC